MRRIGKVVRYALWAGVAAGVLLALVSFVRWRADQAEIREIVGEAVRDDAPPSERMRQALRFMVEKVGYKQVDGYFLLPPFRFMKPTALQVMRGSGGDCAYRARAYIVLLRQHGVEASKLALYDARGRPVHAVVEVKTEKGPYVVDLLFDIIHEDDKGDPIPLSRLIEDPAVLAESVQRAVAKGNPRAEGYPLEKYGYHEVRTLNWDKSAAMRLAYKVVSAVAGEEEARRMPRPYLSEEPALMTIVVSGAGAGGCLVLLGAGAWWRRRKRRRQHGGEREGEDAGAGEDEGARRAAAP